MSESIHTGRAGGVNSYLVAVESGYILIDTGFAHKRAELEAMLAQAGCVGGMLKLIILTHGDVDHAGNAAYLRDQYGAPIVIHPKDVGMVESGDMRWNRKDKADKVAWLFRLLQIFDRTAPL